MSKSMVQVKFTIDSNIASAFKAHCVSKGISMASVISRFMETSKPEKNTKEKTNTRPQRKKAVMKYIGLLENVLYMEEQYRDAIPEQFESRYETANDTCNQLSEAISCLEDAYP